jgi:class 3 adenylate cyclase
VSLKEDIASEVDAICGAKWTTRQGEVVPVPKDIGLESNDGVVFDSAAVLYADLSDSTEMVDTKKSKFAAEVYRGFLAAVARVIRSEGGEITAYDGDRVMSVFLGDDKEANAACCALKINNVVKKIVTPALQQAWNTTYAVKHVVGIDVSRMLVARTGVRGGNDLVWVGRAANYAAKLCAFNTGYPTYITNRVFDALSDTTKFGGNPRRLMWESRSWTAMNKMRIYRSNWTWEP